MAAKDAKYKELLELFAQQQIQQPLAYSLHKELSDRMEKFVYSTEDNSTFELWYERYATLFEVSAAKMANAEKVDLLTQQLSYEDYAKFANTILPLKKATIPFEDAVKELKRIFGRKESQFALRYKCIKTTIESNEDFDAYAARVNLKCEKFDVAKCSADDLKVLVFVQGLNTTKHTQTLEKLLSKLDEQEKKREAAENPETVPTLKLSDVVNIATRLGSLKIEKSMVLDTPGPEIMAIQQAPWRTGNQSSVNNARGSYRGNQGNRGNNSQRQNTSFLENSNFSTSTRKNEPKFQCHGCGAVHYYSDCPFKMQICGKCEAKGHKTGFCKQSAEIREQNLC